MSQQGVDPIPFLWCIYRSTLEQLQLISFIFFLHALIIFQLKFKSMRCLNDGLSILIIFFQLRSIINRTKFNYKINYNLIQYLFTGDKF